MARTIARYSPGKLRTFVIICLPTIVLAWGTPWLIYGSWARFFSTSDMTYAWVGVLALVIPTFLVLTFLWCYRLASRGGAGIVLDDSQLTILGLRVRTFARSAIRDVRGLDGKFSYIGIAMRDSSESRVDVSMMAGSREAIASALRAALCAGAES